MSIVAFFGWRGHAWNDCLARPMRGGWCIACRNRENVIAKAARSSKTLSSLRCTNQRLGDQKKRGCRGQEIALDSRVTSASFHFLSYVTERRHARLPGGAGQRKTLHP